MQFSKISEQNAWDEVDRATREIREVSSQQPEAALVEWFRSRGVQIESAVFPCNGKFDENTWSGTLIADDRRVIEYFVDLQDPEEGEFEDVTDELGPKDPAHPESDRKNLITMGLLYFDAKKDGKAA